MFTVSGNVSSNISSFCLLQDIFLGRKCSAVTKSQQIIFSITVDGFCRILFHFSLIFLLLFGRNMEGGVFVCVFFQVEKG